MENMTTPNFGYNAATDVYQDLLEAGIIDPTKVGSRLDTTLGLKPSRAPGNSSAPVLVRA
eukprot:1161900-Pelagomonas_calceolata.AAC.1